MRAIFIDIDNTLLDFDEYVRTTLRSGFEKFGICKYEPFMYDVFTRINDELWKGIEKKELSFDELKKIRFNKIFEALGLSFDGTIFEAYFRQELNESVIEIAGATQMLNALSRNYILCAASNGPYNQQMHRLQKANMAPYFSHFFISEKVGASKPSTLFFDRCFAALNENQEIPITPQECLIIGDSITSDIAGGYDYGLKTCYYKHRLTPVRDSRIDLYTDNLLDIPELITTLV